jgi:DNA-binding MarR family transcriptional regulator
MTPDQTPTPEQRLNARITLVSRILADHRFNHAEKLLYIHLLVLCDEQGICRMTGRELFKVTHISTGTISTALAHLEELGYLHSSREQREGGRRGAYLIRIPVSSRDA